MPRDPSFSFDPQRDLFDAATGSTITSRALTRSLQRIAGDGGSAIGAALHSEALAELAAQLEATFGGRLYLGTSSWNCPGWSGLVWDEHGYSEAQLARDGLHAYAQHPLLRTVSLEPGHRRAIDRDACARLAGQTPDRFRFVVNAPSEITDALLRSTDNGAPLRDNPRFLDARLALDGVVVPAVQSLGPRLGAVVFQFPPLPVHWLRNSRALLDRMETLWRAVVPAMPTNALTAIEVSDSRMLTPALIAQLARHRVAYCIGLHDHMPLLRQQMSAAHHAGGGGDLICRWSLRQGVRYNQAKAQWAPFNRMQAPDVETRNALAQAVVGTLSSGHRAFVTIDNKAEGSAPLSVVELARAILLEAGTTPKRLGTTPA
jgi:uncharacterized protein YecE (DUF72 family)